jgi:hypothetical protein
MKCIQLHQCPIHWSSHPDCPVRRYDWRKTFQEIGETCPRPDMRTAEEPGGEHANATSARQG